MKWLRLIAVMLLSTVLFAACASTGKRLSRVSVGMDKSAVLQTLGTPHSFAGSGNVEVLHYRDHPKADIFNVGPFTYYFVRLVEGKVESYGLESKKQPVTDLNPPLKSTN